MKTSIICATHCWSSSVTCRLACAWRRQWTKLSQSELHSHAILHSTVNVTRVTVVDFLRSGCCEALSLSDTFVALQFVPAQTLLVDELLSTLLVLHRWEESQTQTIGLYRQTVSTEDMLTSTASTLASLKHHSRLLREYHFISCLTMAIMGNSEGCSTPCWRLAATACKRLPHMKIC